MAMINLGRTESAQEELKRVMARPDVQKSHGQMAELRQTAARIEQAQGNIPGAIEYMNQALNDAVLIDTKKIIPELQSELSNLYRLSGNLPKAEEFASEAARSAQSFGIIPQIPIFLGVLAQIQIAQRRRRRWPFLLARRVLRCGSRLLPRLGWWCYPLLTPDA